jgi:hypothetical protein
VSTLYASNRCDIAIYQYSQGHEIAYVEAYKMLASIIDKENTSPAAFAQDLPPAYPHNPPPIYASPPTYKKQRNRTRNAKLYRLYNHRSEGRDVERFD